MNSDKIILDLCGGTGAWSRPYKEAGYDVRVITLPEYDVTHRDLGFEEEEGELAWKNNLTDEWLYIPMKNIHGILAAPPCTMFSLARTTAKTPRDLDGGLIPVISCMDIIWKVKPKFWAMENPQGLLRKFMGRPAYSFDPSEFGEDYNKTTDLWGYFNFPKKKFPYQRFDSTDKNTRKLPEIPQDYVRDPGMSTVAIKRSITAKTFANAFFKANP